MKGVVESVSRLFEVDRGLMVTDGAVQSVIEAWPKNTEPSEVLTKVCVINGLYRTFIMNIDKMANHICGLARNEDLDSLIEAGDLAAVENIRRGHGIKRRSAKHDSDFYSFATKYCFWHNPAVFPMYDVYTHWTLLRLAWTLGEKTRKLDMRKYETWKGLVDFVRQGLDLDLDYKKFDQAVWLLGKYYCVPNQLSDQLRKSVAPHATRIGLNAQPENA